jgi:hypothetical protein
MRIFRVQFKETSERNNTMTITKDGVWLKDQRGNKASVEYFGDEASARKALESLKNCDDCINCSDCSDCSDCSVCSGCSDCSDCSNVSYFREKEGAKGDPNSAAPTGVPSIPRIENIHQAVYAAASNPKALEMGAWHSCETTHCRAGWVTHLAGPEGAALEKFHNTELAAMLIYRESSDIEVYPWRFYQSADEALADMKRCADEEAALSGEASA